MIDLEGDQVEPTAKFSLVVRPVLNPSLTQFCTRYTSIRQDEVDAAQSYPEANAALTEFVTQLDTLPGGWSWGSWGASDLELLKRNMARNGCANQLLARPVFRPQGDLSGHARRERRNGVDEGAGAAGHSRSGQGPSRVW